MSDANKLDSLFQSGKLLHPARTDAGIIEFARDLHRLAGGQPDDSSPTRRGALKGIGDPRHLVFLLVDGLGMNFVESMDREAFIPGHLIGEMRSIFPSTTPTVLTSLATGKWPAEHAVMGWHTKLPEIQAVSTIIRYQRCPDEVRLSKFGVTSDQAYPVPSRMPSANGLRHVTYLVPEAIAGSVYSRYWSSGVVSKGYKSITGAVNRVIKSLAGARGPTFTYLYMPQVDRAAHRNGTRHDETLSALYQVDKAVEMLASSLPADARLIVTADHGHLDAGPENMHSLEADDKLLSYCSGPPSGDIRLMYVTVCQENAMAFRQLVYDRYGEDFLVLTTEEAERLDLFGPIPLSPVARSRIGNMMVISTGQPVLDFRAALGEKTEGRGPKSSDHSGLTPDEMRIPLVII